ncbi:MAG: transposase [Pseudomonadota bacterium]
MAYLARQDIIFNGATFHITWQCHNFDFFLESDEAKKVYYNLLLKYKKKYGVTIYSYCLMSNHPHLTGFTKTVDGLSAFMRTVNSMFSRWYNRTNGRRGQVIMDRFKSPVIQTDEVLLCVMTYGDLNPVRANMVTDPKDHKWSSYCYYAYGEADPLITPAQSYLNLGKNDHERREEYRRMVRTVIVEDGKNWRRKYSNTYCIGNPDWVKARFDKLNDIKRAKRDAYSKRQREYLNSMFIP